METFLPSYNEISPVISDRKIFQVFYKNIYGNSAPPPGGHVFLKNPNGLNNLGTESQKEHFCKIILQSVQWFLIRRFLFLIRRFLFLIRRFF